jgi:ATP-dependent Clp protease adaptor protein ClpS
MSVDSSIAALKCSSLSARHYLSHGPQLQIGSIPEHAHSNEDDFGQLGGEGQLVLDREKVLVRPPPMYRVIMLDDDFTPMDFVVETLQQFFGFSRERATETMLKVHNQGYALCGIFTRDVAETKAGQVLDFAREHQHPLFCRAEPQEE